ncbi:hypothetical protein INS49_003976 [Diaporthe citri]|uniref:uncharacterized protein n=1 Tax=Diaporthe citri TaxID=83186 RepID=UPI001C7FA3CB|nr:uncharacterized protein INS49_003976 [Diaporthe citri]KAG6354895.1 hypothetical protein INS49_003976 [Diaporthe citri]
MSLSPRVVVHVQTDPEKAVNWVVENMQPAQLDDLYGGGGSRSASPNKRKRTQSSTRNNSVHNDVGLSRDTEINMLYQRITEDHEAHVPQKRRRDLGMYNSEQWERRGRPRKRRSWGTENPAATDHEDSASPISTDAFLGHDSFTTASPVEQQEDPELSMKKTEPSPDDSCTTVGVDGQL